MVEHDIEDEIDIDDFERKEEEWITQCPLNDEHGKSSWLTFCNKKAWCLGCMPHPDKIKFVQVLFAKCQVLYFWWLYKKHIFNQNTLKLLTGQKLRTK